MSHQIRWDILEFWSQCDFLHKTRLPQFRSRISHQIWGDIPGMSPQTSEELANAFSMVFGALCVEPATNHLASVPFSQKFLEHSCHSSLLLSSDNPHAFSCFGKEVTLLQKRATLLRLLREQAPTRNFAQQLALAGENIARRSWPKVMVQRLCCFMTPLASARSYCDVPHRCGKEHNYMEQFTCYRGVLPHQRKSSKLSRIPGWAHVQNATRVVKPGSWHFVWDRDQTTASDLSRGQEIFSIRPLAGARFRVCVKCWKTLKCSEISPNPTSLPWISLFSTANSHRVS